MNFNKEKLNYHNLFSILGIEVDDKKSDYYLFKTSGTTGQSKYIFHKTDSFHQSYLDYIKHYNLNKNDKVLLTSNYDEDGVYSFGMHYLLQDNLIIKDNDVKQKVKRINEANLVFTTPSFMMTFKEYIKPEPHQKFFIGGEAVTTVLKNYFEDFKIDVEEFYGASECSITAYKKLEDEYFNLTNSSIKLIENKIYSPYVCSYIKDGKKIIKIDDHIELSDQIEIKDNNKFKFLNRNAELAKINDQLVSLKEISDFLLTIKEIKDLCLFKTKKDELDIINLFFKSDTLENNDIKDLIIKHFNYVRYIPKNIFKIEDFPLTLMGKKDVRKLEEWMKLKTE
jgi:acyl-coenzyme A synthetase/AMP-(fatty) acid ligase